MRTALAPDERSTTFPVSGRLETHMRLGAFFVLVVVACGVPPSPWPGQWTGQLGGMDFCNDGGVGERDLLPAAWTLSVGPEAAVDGLFDYDSTLSPDGTQGAAADFSLSLQLVEIGAGDRGTDSETASSLAGPSTESASRAGFWLKVANGDFKTDVTAQATTVLVSIDYVNEDGCVAGTQSLQGVMNKQ